MLPYVPIGHSSHVSAEIAPVTSEYLPVGQLPVQFTPPTDPSKTPAAQSSHTVLMPDVALNLPAGQLSHARLTPAVALYLPASQLSHAELTPAVALYVPAPHSWHTLDAGGENFPASQLLQAAEPDTVLCFPATHAVHVPADPV